MLANPAYLDWRDRSNSFLWLQGFAGCGKTILCSTIINDMTKYTASRTQGAIAFYYFDFTNDVKTKTLSCLRSLILQLAEQTADTTSLQSLHRAYAMGTPPIQEFLGVLNCILRKQDRVYIIVDALDECTDQEELFDLLNSIRDWKLECLSILTTSRDEPDIRECIHPAPEQEIRLRNSAIDNDLRLFIVETLQKDKKLQVWSDISPEIEEALTHGAHGMFRWVDCQFQTLRECPSRAEVKKALKNLPETLDKTYERMLRNIRPNLRDYALRLFQWLCIANEPVRLDHVMDAFATSIGDEPQFDPDARFVSSDKVFALCPGLLIIENAWFRRQDYVQIAHYSVKEYLISNRLPIAPNLLCMFRVQLPLANLAMAKTCLVYAIFAPHEPQDLPLNSGLESKASFMAAARDRWPRFFNNANKDSQLMELAISYLTRKKGYTLDADINAAMIFAIERHLGDIETWLVDHHRPSIDPSHVLLAKCEVAEIHSLDFVEFWIEQGADVNARLTYEGSPRFLARASTPLHIAAYKGNVALAQLLLQHGASLIAEDDEGLTPLMVAFKVPRIMPSVRLPRDTIIIPRELIELLWFDGGQDCLFEKSETFLHRVAYFGCRIDGLVGNEVLTAETVAWLIDHGLDPLHKNAEGETPLHVAARCNNPTAIKSLYAATGRSSEYEGCLLAFLMNVWHGKRMLSTAELLFDIDPDPFGEFKYGSDILPFLISEAARYAVPIDGDEFTSSSGFTALILKHEEDPARTKLDLYMSYLEFILKKFSTEVSAILRWLTMKIVKRRDPEFLGVASWSAALLVLSHCLVSETGSRNRESVVKNVFRQIHNLFDKREIFGIGIKELYHLLLCTALERGPLAKLIISQEPAYNTLNLSDDIPYVPWSDHRTWLKSSFVSLMVYREIHPDTQSEDDDDAAFVDMVTHGPHKMVRLLMKRLLLKRACDINHQTREGLTILAGGIAYLPFWMNGGNEVLESCLEAGCDANIQDDAGRTPLMVASYRGADDFVKILLDAGCDANLQDWEGGTPITDIVGDDGFSHDHRQKPWKERFSPVGGHTALMYGVIVGDTIIVELLLENGCDTEIKNNQGRTALDLARQFNESDIVKILEGHERSEQSDDEESEQSDDEEYEQSDDEAFEQNIL